jgi:NitT/TauT family transport system substrate-binding protein
VEVKRYVVLALAACLATAAMPAAAAEIQLAEQFSMGYLQFNVMKRDGLIEKYAEKRGLKDTKVTWTRFSGPAAMNDALLSNSTDIVAGGVPGLIVLWDKTRGTANEVKGICALSSQPFLLNTNKDTIKTIKDFGDEDRIAVPAVKVSVQAVVLQMAAAKAFGDKDYSKLDKLTVSMTPPDATVALMVNSGTITAAFSVPPFQTQQLTQPAIHTVLSSFDVMGPHSFTVAWTSARFRRDNPELYAAFLDAVREATRIVNEKPFETAATWIKDTNSKLPAETVASILTGSNVTWTMVPENNQTFATFMHAAGSIKGTPATWKDLFFAEIHNLPGS